MKDKSKTLPDLVRHAAQVQPDKVAFRCMKKSITYADLAAQMHQTAHTLTEAGLQKGDRVGIFMTRCTEAAVAMYGIMAAGGVYVPLNPAQPLSKIRFLLKDCGIELLIAGKELKRQLPSIASADSGLKAVIGPALDLEIAVITEEEVAAKSKEAPGTDVRPEDEAYILYTSGSTGTPKGIVHTHSSGLAFARNCVETYDLSETDIIGNHAPIYFDISTLALFAGPLVAATVIIASEAHVKMPVSLINLIEKEKITVWYSVPLALLQMLQSGMLESRNIETLRQVIYAGEVFPSRHLSRLMNIWKEVRFSNAYGPTETNICTNYHIPEAPTDDSPVSIGQVWSDTNALILDSDNKPSDEGELLIASATLMKGYYGRPDLDAAVFFRRRNERGEEEIYYRTGDLVTRRSDGNLMFKGRKDRQIKTRGFRVELDEISTVLLQHSSVEEAVVYARKDAEEVTNIEARLILNTSGEAIEEADIRAYLRQKLPWYAVPTKLLITQDIPRTATGKIDLKALEAV